MNGSIPCPKCGFPQDAGETECRRCGVIFAKVRAAVPEGPIGTSGFDENPAAADDERLSSSHPLPVAGRAALLVVLLAWGVLLALSGVGSEGAGKELLHLINLPFHEAGHVFFRPFGQFAMSLGGTLGQLLIPTICLLYLLLKTRDPFGAAVCLWWLGENFIDIAPYVDDARAGQMPLLGGNFGEISPYGFHDWEYLLTETGFLSYDHALARASHLAGSMILAAALVWAGVALWRQIRRRRP